MFGVEVIYTDEFGEWFTGLDPSDAEDVETVVDVLEQEGIALGYPYSSALKGAKFALRELRPSAGRSPLRVVYAFDPRRDAVLIIGGDKGGDPKFYKRIIKSAEKIWKQYLEDLAAGRHDKEQK